MKHIKKFESFEDNPKVGDYVKIFGDYFHATLIEFFKTVIGRIIKIDTGEYPYTIEFDEEIPLSRIYSDKHTMDFTEDEIIEWAYDKDIIKNNYYLIFICLI